MTNALCALACILALGVAALWYETRFNAGHLDWWLVLVGGIPFALAWTVAGAMAVVAWGLKPRRVNRKRRNSSE